MKTKNSFAYELVPMKYCTLFMICYLCLSTYGATNDSEPFYYSISEGIMENSKKLNIAVLSWKLKAKNYDSSSTHPGIEGTYKLWWDGRKIAIKSWEDSVSGSEEMGWIKSKDGKKFYKVYDGNDFRIVTDVNTPTSISLENKPSFFPNENWFDVIHWPGESSSILTRLKKYHEMQDIECNWSVVEKERVKLIKLVCKNKSFKEGTYRIEYYDSSKGYNQVCSEDYFNGIMKVKTLYKLNLVSGDVWFPVAVDTKFYGSEGKDIIQQTTFEIDLQNSSFNDLSAIPNEIFKLEVKANMKVNDFRSGVLISYRGKQVPQGLLKKPLPELKDLKLNLSKFEVNDKRILVCFIDIEQRPSRNCMTELSKRAQELKSKDIEVIGIQASKIEQVNLDELIKKMGVLFPVWMIEKDEEKTRFNWGVKALPWLILTDKQHIVRAEGFSIDDLDNQILKSGDIK